MLRPGGRLLFIEHVLASPEHWGLQLQQVRSTQHFMHDHDMVLAHGMSLQQDLLLSQRLLQPLQRLAADNCHLCRQTGSLLRSSSLFKQVCDSAASLLQHVRTKFAVPAYTSSEDRRHNRAGLVAGGY